jgi:hypothetical protein
LVGVLEFMGSIFINFRRFIENLRLDQSKLVVDGAKGIETTLALINLVYNTLDLSK